MYALDFCVPIVTYWVTTRQRVSKQYFRIFCIFILILSLLSNLAHVFCHYSSAATLSTATSRTLALPSSSQFNWQSPDSDPPPPTCITLKSVPYVTVSSVNLSLPVCRTHQVRFVPMVPILKQPMAKCWTSVLADYCNCIHLLSVLNFVIRYNFR